MWFAITANRQVEEDRDFDPRFVCGFHETLLGSQECPLMKSPAESLPQDTQQEESAAKGEDL